MDIFSQVLLFGEQLLLGTCWVARDPREGVTGTLVSRCVRYLLCSLMGSGLVYLFCVVTTMPTTHRRHHPANVLEWDIAFTKLTRPVLFRLYNTA